MAKLSCYWPRAIIHVDMNAFFASVEQRDFPQLRGQPVGVTNGVAGSTLITCSYEARARGIKTGMRIYEARKLCPEIIKRPARPQVYTRVATKIMRALEDISPDIEVFSVDEAFIDVTHCQRLHGAPEYIARLVQRRVAQASGSLPCSVGVSGSKSLAKYASDVKKPNGITVIPPWEARQRIHDVPLEKICGIGPRTRAYLALQGIDTCGQLAELPMAVLARRYGVVGKHLWRVCRGQDTEPVEPDIAPPQSIGHGKVLPPQSSSRRAISTYLRHMCEKVAARLRRLDMQAGRLFIGLRYQVPQAGVGKQFELPYGLADGKQLFAMAKLLLAQQWHGEVVTHVQVSASHLRNTSGQLEMFSPEDMRSGRRFRAMDRINEKYGEFTLAPATLLERSSMPNVIAPAWRPHGHRQHIPD